MIIGFLLPCLQDVKTNGCEFPAPDITETKPEIRILNSEQTHGDTIPNSKNS
jgi:hypothetical protein